jgi:hypothetical protein
MGMFHVKHSNTCSNKKTEQVFGPEKPALSEQRTLARATASTGANK